ncbi:MAG: AbrB/MazE/SpoVT family DNA-binding domain-containing protein [Candidatus Nomurabacteria bacterium]|jgi:AbrB family looped-hinge helix DNA binding protein|nr:AbrB/MazE/SpoVT family DNA-binding domain-containing protein [Candidatus Nomurabacteria bacterium]
MHDIHHKFRLYGVGTIGPKGQIVIPVEARREMNLNPGDKVVLAGLPHEKAITVVDEHTFERHMGMMRQKYHMMGEMLDDLDTRKKPNA